MVNEIIETRPVELSADSVRNAYSHNCDKVQAYKNYAVCLHLMDHHKKSGIPYIYADCNGALNDRTCPALKMRKEELEKGQAIYFMERIRSKPQFARPEDFKEVTVSSYKPKRAVTKPVEYAKEPPKPKSAVEQFLGGGADIGSAINEVMKERKVEKVEHKAGESLIEMVRRMKEEKRLKETT